MLPYYIKGGIRMADGIENNLFLINAPAGSGKTTTILSGLKR